LLNPYVNEPASGKKEIKQIKPSQNTWGHSPTLGLMNLCNGLQIDGKVKKRCSFAENSQVPSVSMYF
jgi:hypothetical protein